MNNEDTLHPGQILNDQFLIPRQISINRFAKQTGITENHIKDLISGRRSISKTTANILAKNLDTHPEYWIDLQREYDFHITRKLMKGIIPDNDTIENIMINNPHDKLIKIVFSDRQEVVEFFQNKLPQEIVEIIDWDTLQLEGSSYIDEEMQESESDLLYSAYFKESNEKCFLYLLFEHQTKPEKWMGLRLLRYKTRIWDNSFNKHPNQEKLLPILSMVLYIGADNWNYSTEFSDLICETRLDSKYIPKFEHILFNYQINNEELKGAIKARFSYLLIQCHFRKNLEEMFEILAKFFNSIPKTEGINYVKVFWIYIATTQKNEANNFRQFVKNNPEKIGGDIMTIFDEWRLEGRLEGEIKLIENMIKAGFDWPLIQNATGISSKKYKEMKNKLQNLISGPMIAEQTNLNNVSYSQLSV